MNLLHQLLKRKSPEQAAPPSFKQDRREIVPLCKGTSPLLPFSFKYSDCQDFLEGFLQCMISALLPLHPGFL